MKSFYKVVSYTLLSTCIEVMDLVRRRVYTADKHLEQQQLLADNNKHLL